MIWAPNNQNVYQQEISRKWAVAHTEEKNSPELRLGQDGNVPFGLSVSTCRNQICSLPLEAIRSLATSVSAHSVPTRGEISGIRKCSLGAKQPGTTLYGCRQGLA